MGKREITPEEAIRDIRELFGLDKEGTQSRESEGHFFIVKTEYERDEVIIKLHDYFSDKVFIPGWCIKIDSFTLVWTTFQVMKIEDLKQD